MLALCYSKLTGGGSGGGLRKVLPKRGVRAKGQHNRAGQVWVHGNLNFRFNCQMKNEFRFSTRIENFEFKELEWNQLIYIWLRREIPSSLFTNFSFLPLAYFPRPNCFSFCAGLLSPSSSACTTLRLPLALPYKMWFICCENLFVESIFTYVHVCMCVCTCTSVQTCKMYTQPKRQSEMKSAFRLCWKNAGFVEWVQLHPVHKWVQADETLYKLVQFVLLVLAMNWYTCTKGVLSMVQMYQCLQIY